MVNEEELKHSHQKHRTLWFDEVIFSDRSLLFMHITNTMVDKIEIFCYLLSIILSNQYRC